MEFEQSFWKILFNLSNLIDSKVELKRNVKFLIAKGK